MWAILTIAVVWKRDYRRPREKRTREIRGKREVSYGIHRGVQMRGTERDTGEENSETKYIHLQNIYGSYLRIHWNCKWNHKQTLKRRIYLERMELNHENNCLCIQPSICVIWPCKDSKNEYNKGFEKSLKRKVCSLRWQITYIYKKIYIYKLYCYVNVAWRHTR